MENKILNARKKHKAYLMFRYIIHWLSHGFFKISEIYCRHIFTLQWCLFKTGHLIKHTRHKICVSCSLWFKPTWCHTQVSWWPYFSFYNIVKICIIKTSKLSSPRSIIRTPGMNPCAPGCTFYEEVKWVGDIKIWEAMQINCHV